MPKIEVDGKHIFYETHGEGEPLVLLNGIMMSTASWQGFIDIFSKNYQLVLLDFIDQGQSDQADSCYTQQLQVKVLIGLLDHLKLDKVHVIGISYGGEVAMQFALEYQNRLLSLILANTTSYTNYMLQDIGQSWINATKTYDGTTFLKAIIPMIYSPDFYEEQIEWLRNREELFKAALTKEWYDGFIRLVGSAETLNITDVLHKIKIPTLIIGSDWDIVTPIPYQQKIHTEIAQSKFVVIKGAGHASMYEKPHEFSSIVLGFLSVYKKSFNIK